MLAKTRTKIWRQKNKARVKAYEKSRYSKTHSRVKARRKLVKSLGPAKLRNKSVDHRNGNAMDNSRGNLRVVHRYHKNLRNGRLNKARTR